jgi:hypothetical protein
MKSCSARRENALCGNRLPPGDTCMGSDKKKPSRQRIQSLKVWVLPAEASAIKSNAKDCSLPVAAYLRNLGLNYKPKTILDANSVLELVKVNGDLGRLGGLLKMLLTNEEKVKALGKEQVAAKIDSLLEEIEATQALLFETVKRV